MRSAILPRSALSLRALSRSQRLGTAVRPLAPHLHAAVANWSSSARSSWAQGLGSRWMSYGNRSAYGSCSRDCAAMYGATGRHSIGGRLFSSRYVLPSKATGILNRNGILRNFTTAETIQSQRRLFSSGGLLQRQYVYRTFQQGARNAPHIQYQGQGNDPYKKKRESKLWMLGCVVFGVGFYVYNLDRVPMTGRLRFNMVSDSLEQWLGQRELESALQEHRHKILPAKHPWVIHVRHVMSRILEAHRDDPDMQNVNWQVYVVNAPNEFNAFVLPGGQVFVFTGMLRVCKDEEGLATVLGHEIAHVRAHHLAERMSQNILTLIGTLISIAYIGIFGLGYYQFSHLETILPHSRIQEEEADRIDMLAKSCYEPAAAPELWRRLDAAEQIKVPEILSTHPTSQKRMETLTKLQAEAEKVYMDMNCGPTFRHYRNFSDFWRYF